MVKIISGGQTGADRAGLDVALECGLEIGGWVPRGRRAEDGRVPEKYAGMTESLSDSYEDRTRMNVGDSDATVIFTFGPPSGGSAYTQLCAASLGKPVLILDLEKSDPAEVVSDLRAWLSAIRPRILNVAGSRSSEAPRISWLTANILKRVLGESTAPANPHRDATDRA